MMCCWCRTAARLHDRSCVFRLRDQDRRGRNTDAGRMWSPFTHFFLTHMLSDMKSSINTPSFFFYKRVLSARRIEQKHFQTALRNSTWQDGVVKMLLVAMWLQGPGSFLWFPHEMCAVLLHSLITDRQQRLYRYYKTDLTRIITNSSNECSFAFS